MASAEVARIRRLIDGLRRDRRTHPQHGRREYSQLAREVAAACEELIATEPAAVPALTRRAVERITTALMYIDDSGGGIGHDLHEMMALHARACAAAPPEPRRLATWLARLRLDGPGWPDFELRDFAAALGEKGRAELTRIVDDRASTAEPDLLGKQPFEIRILREQLAELSGDVDHLVAVLSEDLNSRQYLKIVAALREASRMREAEQWAQHGLSERGSPRDVLLLRDAYVDLLLERDATADALDVCWRAFDTQPLHGQYRALRRTAQRTGEWARLRGQVLARLWQAVASNPAFADPAITVLLDEREPDEAWRLATMYADSLGEARWRDLIELRQPDHPGDVIEPWQRLIEQRLDTATDKYRYTKVVTMLRQLRKAHQAVRDTEGFETYLNELRTRHRRKSAFLAKLDKAGL